MEAWAYRPYSGLVLTTKTLLFVFALTFAEVSRAIEPDDVALSGSGVVEARTIAVKGQVDASFEFPAQSKNPRQEWKVQELPRKSRPWANPFYVGEAMAIGGIAADAGSSWGCLESNSLLRSADGRFGARGLLVKASMSGGAVVVSHLLYRKYPKLGRPLGIVLAVTGGMLQGVALRNRMVGCY